MQNLTKAFHSNPILSYQILQINYYMNWSFDWQTMKLSESLQCGLLSQFVASSRNRDNDKVSCENYTLLLKCYNANAADQKCRLTSDNTLLPLVLWKIIAI